MVRWCLLTSMIPGLRARPEAYRQGTRVPDKYPCHITRPSIVFRVARGHTIATEGANGIN